MKKSWILFALMGIVLTYTMYEYMGIGSDWHFHFYKITRAYLEGQTYLYDFNAEGWYNPPWLLPFLIPFSLLPEREGLLLFRLVSFAIIFYSTTVFANSKLSFILVLISLSVWDTIIVGNVDVLVLLGLTMLYRGRDLWGLSLVLATVKPQLAILPLFVLVIRRFNYRMLIIPCLFLLISFLTSGIDWPWRFVKMTIGTSPLEANRLYNIALGPIVDTWLFLPLVIILLITLVVFVGRSKPRDSLALSTAITPLIVPYFTSTGLILPMVIAWTRIEKPLLATVIYLMQFLMVLRAVYGWEISWILLSIPLTLTIGLLSEMLWNYLRSVRKVKNKELPSSRIRTA